MKHLLLLLSLSLTGCELAFLGDGLPGVSSSRRESQRRKVYLHDYEVVSCSNPRLEPFVRKDITTIWAERAWTHTAFLNLLNDTRTEPFDTNSNTIVFKLTPRGKKFVEKEGIDFWASDNNKVFISADSTWLVYTYPLMNPKDVLGFKLVKNHDPRQKPEDLARVILRKVPAKPETSWYSLFQ